MNLKSFRHISQVFESHYSECLSYVILEDTIREIPAADVAPVVHGYWIPIAESKITGFNPEFAGCDPIGCYQCSNCK